MLRSLSSIIFFFKQRTAYEMRISDWSSDVCSSDLLPEQIVEPQPLDPRAKPDPDRAFGIVRAHRDHRTFESRIADSGHREQELAGKICARTHETDHNGWPRARPRLKSGRSFPSSRVPHGPCRRPTGGHTQNNHTR